MAEIESSHNGVDSERRDNDAILISDQTNPKKRRNSTLEHNSEQAGDVEAALQPIGRWIFFLITFSFVIANFIVALDGSILGG
jgi:hypothetical protein